MQLEPDEHTKRLHAIDAARGTAMFFVCLSHFGLVSCGKTQIETKAIFERIGMVASPTFMLISGLMLGFLYQTCKSNREQLRHKLFDKGLFLLTIGHALMVGSYIYYWGSLSDALRHEFITDTIGVFIIIGPLLIPTLPIRSRLVLSFALCSLSWLIMWVWHPRLVPLEIMKEVVFGMIGGHPWLHYSFPLVPWFSLYLAATCIGEQMGTFALAHNVSSIKRLLTRVALGGLLSALLLKSGYVLFSTRAIPLDSFLWALTRPFQKLPPSPGYFALYGSLGLLILRGFVELEEAQRGKRLVTAASIVGQVSLFAFLVQSYMYFTVLEAATFLPPIGWPLTFFGSVALQYGACVIWHHTGGNRFFTMRFLPLPWIYGKRWGFARTATNCIPVRGQLPYKQS